MPFERQANNWNWWAIENDVSFFHLNKRFSSSRIITADNRMECIAMRVWTRLSSIGDVIICWTNVKRRRKKKPTEFQTNTMRFTSSDNNTQKLIHLDAAVEYLLSNTSTRMQQHGGVKSIAIVGVCEVLQYKNKI